MKTFKVPISSADLPRLVRKFREDADKRLREFCTKQILDKKLSTKTFSYDFDLSNSRSGGQRKSIQKLKDLIYKAVKKRILYLDYVRQGDMVVNGGTNSVFIQLYSPCMQVSGRVPSDLLRTKWATSINRYCRYLNFKCIKYGIPINLSTSFSHVIHPDDQQKWEKRSGEVTVRLNMTASITVKLVLYSFPAYENFLMDPAGKDIKSYEDYEQYVKTKVSEGDTSWKPIAEMYKNQSNWRVRDFPRRGSIRYYRGLEKYYCAEKLFLILDEMQQVIKAFSRKTSYDTTAFNIGSDENT